MANCLRPLRSAATFALLLLVGCTTPGTRKEPPRAGPLPLTRAHAHNDYEHARPLFDALEQGFCSVEADIFLVDGALLVAHERAHAVPGRTLENLYLEPLRKRAQAHGGRIHPGGPSLALLIDIKTEAEPTYRALREVLRRYDDLLTRFEGAHTVTNAVTAILSGNRPIATLAAETTRHAALDGRPEDLDRPAPPNLVPWISQSWASLFSWRGGQPMPEPERIKLAALVRKAHDQGRLIRFWGLPDNPETWSLLWEAGVDWINTDKLAELRRFMLGRMPPREGRRRSGSNTPGFNADQFSRITPDFDFHWTATDLAVGDRSVRLFQGVRDDRERLSAIGAVNLGF